MCTENAKFLEKPIAEMVGYKVFSREKGVLKSPVFDWLSETPWVPGITKVRTEMTHHISPENGFHFFPSWLAAWWWKSRGQVVRKVKAYNVFGVGENASAPFGGKVYIAEKMELL